MICATYFGHFDAVELLLQRKAKVNVQNNEVVKILSCQFSSMKPPQQSTPLHWLVSHTREQSLKIVKILVESDADLSIADKVLFFPSQTNTILIILYTEVDSTENSIQKIQNIFSERTHADAGRNRKRQLGNHRIPHACALFFLRGFFWIALVLPIVNFEI